MATVGRVLPFAAVWVALVNGANMLQCVRRKSASTGHSEPGNFDLLPDYFAWVNPTHHGSMLVIRWKEQFAYRGWLHSQSKNFKERGLKLFFTFLAAVLLRSNPRA